MDPNPEDIPMERINYESGEDSPRFTLLVFTEDTHKLVRKYGGDPVSPLYGPQDRELRSQERKAAFLTQLIRGRAHRYPLGLREPRHTRPQRRARRVAAVRGGGRSEAGPGMTLQSVP
jgi:hypothetical protein